MSDRERETAAAIGSLYERHASAFAEARRTAPWHERGVFEKFAGLIRTGGDVLDLGCGCGAPIAKFLAECGHRITGIDTSPSLVAEARRLLPGHSFGVGDMRGIDLRRRFAAIVAWDSYFHLKHDAQREMFDVFRRHAADGATVIVNTGPAHGSRTAIFSARLCSMQAFRKRNTGRVLPLPLST